MSWHWQLSSRIYVHEHMPNNLLHSIESRSLYIPGLVSGNRQDTKSTIPRTNAMGNPARNQQITAALKSGYYTLSMLQGMEHCRVAWHHAHFVAGNRAHQSMQTSRMPGKCAGTPSCCRKHERQLRILCCLGSSSRTQEATSRNAVISCR